LISKERKKKTQKKEKSLQQDVRKQLETAYANKGSG
jgi:hypothetical protein